MQLGKLRDGNVGDNRAVIGCQQQWIKLFSKELCPEKLELNVFSCIFFLSSNNIQEGEMSVLLWDSPHSQ